jgi:glycosyltransferase involved in cell wall biosynthesis
MEHEYRGKLLGLSRSHGVGPRLHARAELLWQRLALRRFEARAYLQSCLVLVNYDSVRRLIVHRCGTPHAVRKVPYTSEAAFRPDHAAATPPALAPLRPAVAPLVVAVSRHDPRKGIDVLLRALARLQAAGVPFRACLVGGGTLLAAHRRLADELGLGESTALVGCVPDPCPYLRAADLFVLPSLEEASGSLSLIEALQAGVAVVASAVDGIPEDVTDGDSALLVQPGDDAELSQVLRRLLLSPPLRHRLACRARETFVTKFSPEALTRALKETYAEFGLVA